MDRSRMFINSAKQAFAESRCAAALGHRRIAKYDSVRETAKWLQTISLLSENRVAYDSTT